MRRMKDINSKLKKRRRLLAAWLQWHWPPFRYWMA
jgi:hypothetical protein